MDIFRRLSEMMLEAITGRGWDSLSPGGIAVAVCPLLNNAPFCMLATDHPLCLGSFTGMWGLSSSDSQGVSELFLNWMPSKCVSS